jgi:uncharacterized protein YqgC (DUF456 family)
MEIVGIIFFVLGLALGLIVIPIGFAGTFIIVVDALIYAWIDRFETLTGPFIGILAAIALAAELVEFLLGAVAAKRYGSSWWGIAGSIVGGIMGAVWGTAVSPIAGTIFGAFLGAFLGAFFLEYLHLRDSTKALNAGWGAFVGTAAGRILKFVAAIAMIVMIAYRLI